LQHPRAKHISKREALPSTSQADANEMLTINPFNGHQSYPVTKNSVAFHENGPVEPLKNNQRPIEVKDLQ
jgi:hypothetical protein